MASGAVLSDEGPDGLCEAAFEIRMGGLSRVQRYRGNRSPQDKRQDDAVTRTHAAL